MGRKIEGDEEAVENRGFALFFMAFLRMDSWGISNRLYTMPIFTEIAPRMLRFWFTYVIVK